MSREQQLAVQLGVDSDLAELLRDVEAAYRRAEKSEPSAGSGGATGDSGLGCAGRTTSAPAQVVPWYRAEMGGMA